METRSKIKNKKLIAVNQIEEILTSSYWSGTTNKNKTGLQVSPHEEKLTTGKDRVSQTFSVPVVLIIFYSASGLKEILNSFSY